MDTSVSFARWQQGEQTVDGVGVEYQKQNRQYSRVCFTARLVCGYHGVSATSQSDPMRTSSEAPTSCPNMAPCDSIKPRWRQLYCQTQSIRIVVEKPMVDVRVGFYTWYNLFIDVCCCCRTSSDCCSVFFRSFLPQHRTLQTPLSKLSVTLM